MESDLATSRDGSQEHLAVINLLPVKLSSCVKSCCMHDHMSAEHDLPCGFVTPLSM